GRWRSYGGHALLQRLAERELRVEEVLAPGGERPAASGSPLAAALAVGLRPALLVQPLGRLFRIPLVVQLQQPAQSFPPGDLADRVADALLRLVKTVPQVEVRPAVGRGDGVVHLDVEVAQATDVLGGFLRAV